MPATSTQGSDPGEEAEADWEVGLDSKVSTKTGDTRTGKLVEDAVVLSPQKIKLIDLSPASACATHEDSMMNSFHREHTFPFSQIHLNFHGPILDVFFVALGSFIYGASASAGRNNPP